MKYSNLMKDLKLLTNKEQLYGIIPREEAEFFEFVTRNIIFICGHIDNKSSKLYTIIGVTSMYNNRTITKDNKKYHIAILIKINSLQILQKKGYYIAEGFFMRYNNYNNEIYIDRKF